MTMVNRCDCCYSYGCDPCTGGGPVDLVLQATISGYGQVNTPANEPDPCGIAGNCTNLNKTVTLGSWFSYTPQDATLAAAYDVAAGTTACGFGYEEEFCTDIFHCVINLGVYVTIYQKNGGGVGAYIAVKLSETNTVDGFNGCDQWSEALVTVDASDTTNCAAISFSDDLTAITASCFGGGPGPVWCDGSPVNLLVENAP